jgi:hypothetical protein
VVYFVVVVGVVGFDFGRFVEGFVVLVVTMGVVKFEEGFVVVVWVVRVGVVGFE